MRTTFFSLLAIAPLIGACGASTPLPAQRMADATAAERSAAEVGAATEPSAQLHLKLADEQIVLARKAINDGDNARADSLLIRAKADAELALSLAREKNAKIEAQKVIDDANAQAATNAGAVK